MIPVAVTLVITNVAIAAVTKAVATITVAIIKVVVVVITTMVTKAVATIMVVITKVAIVVDRTITLALSHKVVAAVSQMILAITAIASQVALMVVMASGVTMPKVQPLRWQHLRLLHTNLLARA